MERYHDYVLKLVVVGDVTVGKTSLSKRLRTDIFSSDEVATTSPQVEACIVRLGGKHIKLSIWDIPGWTPSGELIQVSCLGAHGVIFVYDIANKKSFMNVPWVWMKKTGVDRCSDDLTKLLIGNKCDRQAERQVNYTRGKEFAERQGFLFAEASARDGSNVNEAFMKITTEIMNKLDPQRRKRLLYATLYAEDTVKPNIMKIFFIGAKGAGKTTLMKSLKRGLLKAVVTYERQHDDPTCEEERTVGINVKTVDIPGVGRFSLWDLAGEESFHKTHGLFFSSSRCLFILLLSLVTGEERQLRTDKELIAEARYWLSFLRASFSETFTPTVLIAASRADYCLDEQCLFKCVVNQLSVIFHGQILICEHSFLLDCRKSQSTEMKQLRQCLGEVKQQLIVAGVLYPRLCEPVVSRLLPALRQQRDKPFMETREMVKTIEEMECPLQKVEVTERVVGFLQETGEVACVGDIATVKPVWLSQCAIGPLMASNDVKWHTERERSDGTVTREEADRAIKPFLSDHKIKVHITTDVILKMMEDLNLSFKLEGTNDVYMFPAHLPVKKLSDMWVRDDSKEVYVGRRLYCSVPTSIFSPGAFDLFQCKACVTVDRQALLWKNGIIMKHTISDIDVQCLVAMMDSLQAVDFVCRGQEGSETECLSLLSTALSLWINVVLDHSPGTDYEMGYLSRKHLTEHKEPIAICMYTEKTIHQIIQEGSSTVVQGITDEYELVESFRDLMVVLPLLQPRRLRRVIQAILRHVSSETWYELGIALGFSSRQLDSECCNKPSPGGKLLATVHLIITRDGANKAVKVLLTACEKVMASMGDISDELKKYGSLANYW